VVGSRRWQLDIDESPTLVSASRYIPWRDLLDAGTSWTPGHHTYTRAVTTNAEPDQPLLITNNLDATLYIARLGIVPEIKAQPLVIVPPFNAVTMRAPGPQMSIVADCAGYDFATKRTNVAADDVRFSPSSLFTIGPAQAMAEPVQLRKEWTRLYDKLDLTYNNAFINLTSGGPAWRSNYLALEGSSAVVAYGQISVSGATTVEINFYIEDSFPELGTGSYVVGNAISQIVPTGAGTFYQQITLTGPATPAPRLLWVYVAGGAATTTLASALVTVSMSN
jgi:hypothetical protein